MSVLLEQKGGKPQEESGEASGDELFWFEFPFLHSVCPLHSVQFFQVLSDSQPGNAGGNKASVPLAPLMLSCGHLEPVAPPSVGSLLHPLVMVGLLPLWTAYVWRHCAGGQGD